MKTKTLIALASCFLLMAAVSCSEQQSFTQKITGDWWPVHASGSIDNEVFSASWDGDLGERGEIQITMVSKSDPSRIVTSMKYYPARTKHYATSIFGASSRSRKANT